MSTFQMAQTGTVGRWIEEVLFYKSDRSLSFLLGLLLLHFFVIYPFFELEGVGRYLVDVVTSLVLVAGTLAIEARVWRRVALVLAVLGLVTRWATYATFSRPLLIVNAGISTTFLAFASVAILGRVFAEGPITRHRIEGAVAVYLLIGTTFAQLYALIAWMEPEAFTLGGLPAIAARAAHEHLMGRLHYFSFVTLTTVGFGDITPVSPVARQMAVLEALIGQLYPAILLARLVSMEIAGRGEKD